MTSGVGTESRFEHLTLLMLLGLKRVAEIVKAAALEGGGSDASVDVEAFEYMLLGVISLGDRVDGLKGHQPEREKRSDTALDDWILR